MLRLTHNNGFEPNSKPRRGLGQVSTCPQGYTDQTITCGSGMSEQYIPNTQCSRCVPNTPGVQQSYAGSDSDCIGVVQKYLNQAGLLQAQFVNGVWGPETEGALNVKLPTWRSIPGGACGIVTQITLSPPSNFSFASMTNDATSSTGLLVVGGLGLLVVFALLMGKKTPSSAVAA